MSQNYFRTLFACIIISLSLLVAAQLFKLSALIGLAIGVAPLIFYHLGYLTPRAKTGLSQAAVDSVYYFGFLVTIAALGISAITIASSNSSVENVNAVVFQFGIGLFATGYAVLARIHLSSISMAVDSTSPEAIMDRYVKRSLELVDNVEMAVSRTADFSNTVLSKTQQLTETTRVHAEKAMLDVARAFEREMTSTLALTREGLTEVRAMISEVSFAHEREELAKSIKTTVEASNALNRALADYTQNVSTGARVTETATANTHHLTKAIGEMRESVEVLGGEEGAFFQAADAIARASEAIDKGVSTMGAVVLDLGDMANVVADTGPTFVKLRTSTKKAHEGIESLAEVANRLHEASERLQSTAHSAGGLASNMERAASAMPLLAERVDALSTQFTTAGAGAAKLSQRLSLLPGDLSALNGVSEAIREAMQQVITSLERAVVTAEQIHKNTASAENVVAGARTLIEGGAALGKALTELQQQVVGFGAGLSDSHKQLADASSGIKVSMSASASALQEDAKKASDAASLLTDRLIMVAQTIIDQTRKQQYRGPM